MDYATEIDKLYIKYADNPVAMECLEGYQNIFSHYALAVIKRYDEKTVNVTDVIFREHSPTCFSHPFHQARRAELVR